MSWGCGEVKKISAQKCPQQGGPPVFIMSGVWIKGWYAQVP